LALAPLDAGKSLSFVRRHMARAQSTEHFELNDGEVRVWIEQEASIHIKAAAGGNDPVELTESQARKLANALLRMAQKLEESGR